MEYAIQMLVLVLGGMGLGWLAYDRLHWSPLLMLLGMLLGLVAGILVIYKNTVILPSLEAEEDKEKRLPEKNPNDVIQEKQ